MIQCLKHKAKERPEKRRGNKVNDLRPPHLEQPGQRSTVVSRQLSMYSCLIDSCEHSGKLTFIQRRNE